MARKDAKLWARVTPVPSVRALRKTAMPGPTALGQKQARRDPDGHGLEVPPRLQFERRAAQERPSGTKNEAREAKLKPRKHHKWPTTCGEHFLAEFLNFAQDMITTLLGSPVAYPASISRAETGGIRSGLAFWGCQVRRCLQVGTVCLARLLGFE